MLQASIGDSVERGLDEFFVWLQARRLRRHSHHRLLRGQGARGCDRAGAPAHRARSDASRRPDRPVGAKSDHQPIPSDRADRVLGDLLGASPLRLSLRDRRARRPRRGDLCVSAERDRCVSDLPRSRTGGRSGRRARCADDGRHGNREGHRHGRPGPDHGDRRLHDSRPAHDRARNRDHHLCSSDGWDRAGHGARLRTWRP